MGIEIEVEIISKGNIKPASPTPEHLRTYQISILDQLHHHMYVPVVYFYTNNNPPDDSVEEKRQCLKQSLSETLSSFYPLAGIVKDDQHIECNDEGVYYVEARVSNYPLSDFLGQQPPDYELLHRLLPFHPSEVESLGKTNVAMVQVNTFDCGSIAIGVYTSHKIIDGQSHMTFMKSWATIARGSSEKIHPSFISPSLFLPDSSMPKDASIAMWPAAKEQRNNVTKRFVFDAKALSALKAASSSPEQNPSRFTAVTALIWKCAIAASKVKSGWDKPSVLSFAMNLRNRSSPPLPSESIGNIVWSAIAQCMPQSDLELHSIVGCLKNAMSKVSSDFVEKIKGEEGSFNVKETLNEFKGIYSNENADYFAVTSWCNGGLYEVDFGWGKPIWACIGNVGADIPVLTNLVFLMDTRSGDGVEAWVTLNEPDMAILEQDPEILTFASLNPSPLSY